MELIVLGLILMVLGYFFWKPILYVGVVVVVIGVILLLGDGEEGDAAVLGLLG